MLSVGIFEQAQQVFERTPAKKVAHGLLWSVDSAFAKHFLMKLLGGPFITFW
jgi:hypothetical protein